jgi:hypothetical protein
MRSGIRVIATGWSLRGGGLESDRFRRSLGRSIFLQFEMHTGERQRPTFTLVEAAHRRQSDRSSGENPALNSFTAAWRGMMVNSEHSAITMENNA